MRVIFVRRGIAEDTEVASIDEELNWKGNALPIEEIKKEMKRRKLTDIKRLPEIYYGTYFWVYIEEGLTDNV